MSTSDAVQIVSAFHTHLNARAVEDALSLASEDVQVGGPRGVGTGRDLLAEWVNRASITLTPRRWFRSDDTVVVEQDATWHNGAGEVTGSQVVATVFGVENGKIASIARYGFLGEAVNSADMDETHEIPAPA